MKKITFILLCTAPFTQMLAMNPMAQWMTLENNRRKHVRAQKAAQRAAAQPKDQKKASSPSPKSK